MEEIVAPLGAIIFDLERDLDEQIGALPLPFSGMDKSGAAVCVFHLRGTCTKSSMCPYRHVKPDRTIVCKHWLRGLCKKGDSCEFLHEFDMSKMPECYFYSKFRACSNKECPFLHIDPESKVKDCPWYDRGFCRHGPTCRHRHARRVACLSYLCGFCPDGPSCKFVHMRFDIPSLTGPTTGGVMVSATGNAITGLGPDPSQQQQPQQQQSSFNQPDTKRRGVICHHCNEPGHKIYVCPSIPPDQRDDVIAKFAAEQQDRSNHYGDRHHHNNHYQENSHHNSFNRYSNHNSHSNNNRSDHENNLSGGDSNFALSNIISTVPLLERKDAGRSEGGTVGGGGGGGKFHRPLDQVTCFKCGERGHYANRCPKGHLAFLSPALSNLPFNNNSNNNKRHKPNSNMEP
ncbi:Cleavage and polyadenylation specificity factor subunit 4 [Tyrophagus putrescentiae]|nr:Cleavage and polyadenylation specificity factor subunit 4 [Tyrophagus putrescentiae]KAH9410484.1 Cleavage and polyadenylation specificity factor subunit 4 [Tyrophagus putrescentiae]